MIHLNATSVMTGDSSLHPNVPLVDTINESYRLVIRAISSPFMFEDFTAVMAVIRTIKLVFPVHGAVERHR